MKIGTVKWFNAKKGFGFIINDDTGIESFVHWSDINMEGYKFLDEGQKVAYSVEEMRDGKTKAINVEVVMNQEERDIYNRERRLDRKLRKQGYRLSKGRDYFGCIGYTAINLENNVIELGEYTMSLEALEKWADE